jgi:predicted ATPase
LAADPELLAEVSSWYESVNQCALKVRDWPRDYFQVVLEHRRNASFEVDIADSGEGLGQLLPVLTAIALGRRPEQGGPRILAIEEPESHLHPELQMKLAEYLCQPNEGRPLPHLVLETHSEHFLLSVQLHIALGKLSPENVVVYWVRQLEDGRSVADRVIFDENARPVGNSLPPGVFREDLEMARRILEARRSRKKESSVT